MAAYQYVGIPMKAEMLNELTEIAATQGMSVASLVRAAIVEVHPNLLVFNLEERSPSMRMKNKLEVQQKKTKQKAVYAERPKKTKRGRALGQTIDYLNKKR